MSHAIFNGKIIDEREARVSMLDKEYFFDFAVYSSIKVVQSEVSLVEHHVNQLFESAKIIGLEHQFKKDAVASWLNVLVEKDNLTDSLLRIILVGGDAPKLYIVCVGGLTFYPDKLYRDGAKLITYRGERSIPTAKTKDLLTSFLAYREAQKTDAIDALLIDRDGNIREGTRSNFFAVKGRTIITPPADKILSGTTRDAIIASAKEHFEIVEQNIPITKIKSPALPAGRYDEIFVTSTTLNIMPIRQIDDMIFKSDLVVTRELLKMLKK